MSERTCNLIDKPW